MATDKERRRDAAAFGLGLLTALDRLAVREAKKFSDVERPYNLAQLDDIDPLLAKGILTKETIVARQQSPKNHQGKEAKEKALRELGELYAQVGLAADINAGADLAEAWKANAAKYWKDKARGAEGRQ